MISIFIYKTTGILTNKLLVNQCRSFSKLPRTIKNICRSVYAPHKVTPPYNHVAQIGDPVLRTRAQEVPENMIKSREMGQLVENLKFVMDKFNSIGLSAPQIGISLRVFIIDFNKKKVDQHSAEEQKLRQMNEIPFTVFINPIMQIKDHQTISFPEACESVRGYYADVPRFREVVVKAYDEKGISHARSAKGWTARILQHEMDHMDGKIYTDIMHKCTLACGCWEAVNQNRGRVFIPFVPK